MQLSVIQNKIYEIRGMKVMLDKDLTEMYEVPTFRLNEAVKRNMIRFPKDFMFQLTKDEFNLLISQNTISKIKGRAGTRKLLRVFTEQGVAMLSSILNSKRANQVNIVITRTFVLIRQAALANKELYEKIIKLKKKYKKKFPGTIQGT